MSNKNPDYKALFEDEVTLGAAFWLHLITGVVLFCLIFFVGWLVLDYFWASLTLGVFILLFVLNKMLDISMQKNAYDKFTQKTRQDAEQLGLDGEIPESIVEDALRVLANVSSSQQVR